MRTVQRIAKNTFVLTSAEAINKLLSLVLYIAIANYLRVTGYGQFSFIMTLLAIFTVLANFGLDKLTIREVAKDKEKTQSYVALMLKLKVFLALATYIILIACIHLSGKPKIVISGVHLIGLSIIFIALSNTFLAIFNAHERLEIHAVLLVVIKLLILGLVFLTIYLKYGLLFILGVYAIGEFLRLLLAGIIYRKNFYVRKIKQFTPLSYKKTLITAAPFVIIGIASLIYMHIDKVMLSFMKGDEPVGWYSAAFTLLLGLMFIPRSYGISVFPAISRYAKDSDKLLNISWQKSVKFLLIVSLPVTVGVILLAGRFIHLFYHSGYENSINALKILMLTIPWIFVNSINMYLLYAANRQKQATFIVLISTAVNIILNLFLIPKFSYIGASWATVIAEIINVFMFFGFIYFVLNLNARIHKILLKPLLASIIMGTFIYYFKFLNLAFLIFASGAIYIGILILLKVFDEQDKEILKRILPTMKGNR